MRDDRSDTWSANDFVGQTPRQLTKISSRLTRAEPGRAGRLIGAALDPNDAVYGPWEMALNAP